MGEKTVKIKILRSTFVSGDYVEQDETVEVSEKDARLLISLKKAEAVKSKAEKAKK